MLKRVFAVWALLVVSFAHAETPLNRAALAQYFTAIESLQVDLKKHQAALDALEVSQGDQLMYDHKAWARELSAQPFAGEIRASLAANGFKSIEEFTAFGSRLFQAMLAVGAEQMPGQMQAVEALGEQALSTQELAELRAQGVDAATIAQMQANFAEARAMARAMQSAGDSVPEADKAAVRENYQWLQQQFDALDPSEPDDEESSGWEE
ncbi:hypothetical protein L1F30_05015 [Simiduia sp. 21SJ11W-1]|uniref:hypothetical protein n=1 Tax=Simiduia sp. 21SJ11W-1 TaxID=2909669 RepID=UPI0020A13D32|nr:hypothetical protein [Simiduia sp. 21SJ11W-1]UTA48908.1 hypothetical protein L1F30_05015 [Simiduia sp. 21SJ11W-1]